MKVWVGAAMLAAASAFGLPAIAQISSAGVTGGEVQGVAVNGIASFKGIPFAASPVGENRWRSPQPVPAWTGVRQAVAIAPACMQDSGMAKMMGAPVDVSEDCLYLNVWTAAKASGEKLPVMVWIYGGAFAGGATNWPMYDGTRLAEKGVVLPAEKIQGALRGNGGFWPTLDGNVIVGDQYVLYQAGRFNDTPVLIGTNSDEGAMFTPPAVKPADYEKQIRDGYGEKAGVILAANPHATDVEARKAAKNLFRDSVFAWPTWAWANLQSQKGKGGAFVYYFDHRNAMSPDGANHGSEITFVFRNLANPMAPPTEADQSISELMSSYWVNFAKNGDPNGPGLPRWPAFTSSAPKVMHLSQSSGAPADVPNLQQLQALDQYYAWRRDQAKKQESK